MLRTLQQAAGATGSEKVVSVATVTAFQDALREGARYIQITEHLDLTNEDLGDDYDNGENPTLQLLPSTWSIRVRPPCPSLAMTVENITLYAPYMHVPDMHVPYMHLICTLYIYAPYYI
jgi:hypothetical protein